MKETNIENTNETSPEQNPRNKRAYDIGIHQYGF